MRILTLSVLLALTAGLAAGPRGLWAASGQWYLEAQAGGVRPDLAPSGGESDGLLDGLRSVLVGARYDAGPGGFRFSAGLPTRPEEPLWSAASGWGRLALVRREGWFGGIDLGGDAYLVRDRRPEPDLPGSLPGADGSGVTGRALAGRALPVVGFEARRFRIQARSGVSHYLSRLGGQARNHTVWLSEAQSTLAPVAWLAMGPVLRHYRARDGSGTYAGGNLSATYRNLGFWAGAGHWIEREAAGLSWVVGGTLRPHPRAAVSLSRRREAFDPLYLREPQRSWSLGVSIRIGAAPELQALPLTVAGGDGRVTIRVAVADCPSPPGVAGDFNAWQPRAMLRSGEYWTFTARLAPGVYNYSFVDAEGRWFVPESRPGRRDDGMGGHVAVLVVPS